LEKKQSPGYAASRHCLKQRHAGKGEGQGLHYTTMGKCQYEQFWQEEPVAARMHENWFDFACPSFEPQFSFFLFYPLFLTVSKIVWFAAFLR